MSAAMKVSLTFDNGPHEEFTPFVIETLAAYGIKATFFALGKNLASTPLRDIAARAFAAGHHVGNHSYHHATPFGLLDSPHEAVEEILSTDALVAELGGAERLFRPVGRGDIGPHLFNVPSWNFLVEHQFTCVLWNCVPPERLNPDAWMDPAVEICRTQEWSVVVMHDIQSGIRHLPYFIDSLLEHGALFTQEFPDSCTPLRKGLQIGPHHQLLPSANNIPDSRFT